VVARGDTIYNSKREAEEYAYIKSIFKGNVVCPNKDLGELGSMNRYLKVVSDVDAVYATEFNGKQTSYKIIKKKVDKSGNLVQG